MIESHIIPSNNVIASAWIQGLKLPLASQRARGAEKRAANCIGVRRVTQVSGLANIEFFDYQNRVLSVLVMTKIELTRFW